MHLYFAGAEVTSHLATLKACGVQRIAVSAHNLSRNYKDSGLVNWASRGRLQGLEWVLYADSTTTPLSIVTQVLSGAEVQPEAVTGPVDWYTTTWLQDSDLLFLPMWDGTDPGLLREYTEDYDGVMLPDAVVDNPTAVRAAKAALPKMGLLGALTGRTKGLERFDLLLSSAWWAVQKHGETQVWTGDRFVRLNAEDKLLKRLRYADAMAALGVDVDAVMADDPNETLRLAVLSWLKLEQHIAAGHTPVTTMNSGAVSSSPPVLVTSAPSPVTPAQAVPLQPGVARPASLTRHVVLPVMTSQTVTRTVKDDNGNDVVEQSEVISIGAQSMRQCNTCVFSVACPSFSAGSPCAYSIPVTIRNKADISGVLRALTEIQTQRILMGRFGEEINGQADAMVGVEMDRLFRLVKTWRDIEDNRDSLKLSIDAKGEAAASMGVLSRLFGPKVGENATMLSQPIDADEFIQDVTDAD